MKSLTLLALKVLDDLGTRVGISTLLDQKTVKKRVKDEGWSFLAITLAQFAKDFERCLDQSEVTHDLFFGFSKKGRLPRFLGGFFELIFDESTGVLLSNYSIDAIYSIRQFTGMWSKIKADCTPDRDQKAFNEYFESEEAVKLADSARTEADLSDFRYVSQLLFRELFSKLDREIYEGNVLPKHGSGSTAQGILGNKKYLCDTWTERLENIFPARRYLASSYTLSFERALVWLTPAQEIPVKVITVPKTMKTPRIIAKEPVHMMYMQQALLEKFVEHSFKDNLLRMFISFENQEPNQYLAMEGSLVGDLATLDLSAASDRVSNQLVREMMSRFPHLGEAVQATRSQKADVLGHVVRLAKFASMGSALCFPIEAFVFLTLIFVAIQRSKGHPLTIRDIKSFDGSVRVFGDDIIVPVDYVHEVIAVLSSFGLKVNSNKSFWTGGFRESCGKEYFRGYDVSIVKLRTLFPTRSTHVEEIVSLSAFRNLAQSQFLFSTVEFLDSWILGLIPYPFVLETSPVVGRVSMDGHYDVHSWDRVLQRPLVKGMKQVDSLPSDPLDGAAALLKFFLKRGNFPLMQGHLERAGRPSSVRLKAGRYLPF